MRIDRVKYTVNPNTNDEWIGMEAMLEPGESAEEALVFINKKIEDFYHGKGWSKDREWNRFIATSKPVQDVIDPEYEKLKMRLAGLGREAAARELSNSPYRLVKELQDIVNSKPA